MKNILFIEDRILRKELFLKSSQIDFSKYSFLKETTAEEYKQIKTNIKNADTTFLNNFDLIITHKSAFTLNEQDILITLGKSIIFFSGGISQSFYLEYPFPCLHINSSEFYSNNLLNFLNHLEIEGELEMLILQFGTKWKLNLFLTSRDKLKQLLYKNTDKDLYPEDFDEIFSYKLLSIIKSKQLKDSILEIKENGLLWNEVKKVDRILSEISIEISNQTKYNS
jgi:hypothetical protein